ERRNSGSEVRPFYAMELIRKARLGAIRLPVELGGGGASIQDLFRVVIRLAEVDSDVAHILRFHYYQVEQFLYSSDSEERDIWLKRVADGDIIGNAYSEFHNKSIRVLETTLTPDG